MQSNHLVQKLKQHNAYIYLILQPALLGRNVLTTLLIIKGYAFLQHYMKGRELTDLVGDLRMRYS